MVETSPLADAQARQQALDPTRSFVVQAPAGSGKTELLTQRYLRLLTTVEQPEQILAITFTRKAASEMRNRIMQALLRAGTQPPPDKAHEVQQWQLASAALKADAERGWQLLTHPARLRIHTIDALNASLAKRLPILAGLGGHMDIAADILPLYERVGVRLLQQLGNGSETAMQMETVLLHLANRVPDFITMLGQLLARRDHWLPLVLTHDDELQLRERMERTLRAAIEHHLQSLTDSVPLPLQIDIAELAAYSAGNRLKQGAKAEQQSALAACAALDQWPAARLPELEAWRGLAMVLCKDDGEFYRSLTKVQGFPVEGKQFKTRMTQALDELRVMPGLADQIAAIHDLPSAEFTDAQWQVLSALLGLLPAAVAELMLEFQQSGQVDYVEMAQRALTALGSEDQPTDLALAFDTRLKHVLVDEFQDTSVPQMALLRSLLGGWQRDDGRTLFCVGDPMQSIYRFRQAEVGLFLELQAHGLPTVQLTSLKLQTNFRSTQKIVHWVNDTFPQVLPRHDDARTGAVSYSASVPHPAAGGDGVVQIHAGIDRPATLEAEVIAELVRQRLEQDSAQRIAILVSNRSHVNPIAAALKREDIAFNAVEIERLWQRPLVQDLIALTRALLHPADRTAWLACLRAPWCGLELPDLHALAANDDSQALWALLNDAEVTEHLSDTGRRRVARVLPAFAAAFRERARPSLRDWVESCWLALGGAATLRDLNDLEDAQAFFARLDELEVAGDLEDIARLEDELQDLYATSANAAGAQVEIMTIHKSKGLEFDVVILPSLHRGGNRDDKSLLRWARLSGLETDGMQVDGLVLAPPAAQGDEHDAIYRWLSTLEKRRAELERGRLLYVAATRARRELHLFGSARINQKQEPVKPKQGTLLNLLWPQLAPMFADAALHHVPVVESYESAPQRALYRLPVHWQMPVLNNALTGHYEMPVINAELQPEFDWVGETSRHVGTVVHAELERLMKQPVSDMSRWDAAARRASLLLQLAELGIPDALREGAVTRVIQAIHNTLQDARGRWILGIDAPQTEAASELALTGVMGGRIINSVIDRSFVDDSGVRWIVDFKTSIHEGGGREAFLRSEAERYRPQLERYATLMKAWRPTQPVRTALYFPLMGEWLEL